MENSKKAITRKKIIYAIFAIIGIAVIFTSLLIIYSAKWVRTEWNGVDFATIMFQLHTPLKGTNSEIVVEYIKKCLVRAIAETGLLAGAFLLIKSLGKRVKATIKFTVFSLKGSIKWTRKNCSGLLGLCAAGMVCFFTVIIFRDAKELGVFEYLNAISQKSTIFEEYYIEPTEEMMKFPEQKRNLILLYLESMESTYSSTDAGGGKKEDYIPELTSLAQNYINFSESEKLGGGFRNYGCEYTVGAIVGTSAGVPFKTFLDGNSMGEYAEFLPGITTLGDILEQEGYKNIFLCGSDASFGGRDIFYKTHGNYMIHDYYYAIEQGYIPADLKDNYWGYEDKTLYEIAKKELDELGRSGELFNYTMLTVDTHHPTGYYCDLCDKEYDEKYANVVACASRQAADFVLWVQKQPWYENTTIVILGDHTSMVADFWDDIGDYQRKTYNCFINVPQTLDTSNVKNRKFSTLDYFPTILTALGAELEGERIGLGTNLFSGTQTLLEEMGEEKYNAELSYYSPYYVENFEKVK